jgi:hypothetical protein
VPSHGIGVTVFIGVYSNFAVGYSSSDLSVVYYLACRRIFRPVDVLDVYVATSKVGLALEILKLAGVDDGRSVADEHVLSGQAAQRMPVFGPSYAQ